MGHRLPNHNGKCRALHGHTYKVEVTIDGAICTIPNAADEGMVIDFTDIKALLKQELHKLDHKFLLYENDPYAPALAGLPGIVRVSFIPTAENIAQALLNALPAVTRIRLWETPTSFAEVER